MQTNRIEKNTIEINYTIHGPFTKFNSITSNCINIIITDTFEMHPKKAFINEVTMDLIKAHLQHYNEFKIVIIVYTTCYLHFMDCIDIIKTLFKDKNIENMTMDLTHYRLLDIPMDIKTSMINKLGQFTSQDLFYEYI